MEGRYRANRLLNSGGESGGAELDLKEELTPGFTPDSALIRRCLPAGGELKVYCLNFDIKKIDLSSLLLLNLSETSALWRHQPPLLGVI